MKFKKLFGRKKQNRRASRANEFILESLEPRLLLSATPMTAAVVTTDHLDYAPGETAVITSSSQAGELVRFQVDRTDGIADVASTTAGVGPAGNEAWYVIDGIGGFTAHLGSDVSGDGVADWIAPDNDLTVNSSISTTWFVEEQYRHSSLLVTATGQESGAVATRAFTDANLNTTTVVTSSGASTYGDFVTLTATVTPAVGGTTNPVGSVQFFDNGVSLGVMTTAGIGAGSSSTFALTVSSLTAGSHAITAVFTGGANVSDSFNNSTSGILTQTVSQKALVGSFSVVDILNPRFYDGTTNATVVFTGLAGLVGDDFVTLDGGTATFDNANAGLNHIVTLTGATLVDLGDGVAANYVLASVDTTIADIDQATALVTVNDFTGAFDGLAHGATGTVVGVDAGGAALGSTLDLGPQFTVAGTYIVNWVFTGGTNYTDQSGTATIVISDAAAVATTTTVSSSAATSTYGTAVTFTATVSAASGAVAPTGTMEFFDGLTSLGIDSVVDSTGVGTATYSLTLSNLTAGSHAIHAVFTATGSFAGSQSATLTQTVNKAVATVTVSGFTGTYNAAAHGATGTVVGVAGDLAAAGSSLNLGASFTNAPGGTANWSFTGGTNYTDQSGTVAIVINKAAATVTVSGFTGTYNAAAHGATGTVVGVAGDLAAAGSSLNLGASFTNAPGGTASWSFTGGTNYNDQNGTAAIVINKANAVVTVTGFTGAFDNLPHGATGTVVGVDAGGAALGGSLSLGATFTAVPGGIANWIFTGGTNYNNQSGTAAIVISNAVIATTTTVSSSAATSTYGTAVTFTATVSAASGAVAPTGTVEFFDGLTSLGIDSVVDSTGVNTATFSVTLSQLTLSQLGAGAHAITAVFTGGTVGGNSYLNSTSAILTQTVSQKALVGSFSVVDILNPRFYDGTTNATVVFTGLAGLVGDDFVTLDGGTATFDNANAGLNHIVTLTGATLVDLGDGVAANYVLASVDTTIADIDQATALVTVNDFTGAFDGLAHGATGTVVGVDAGGAALGSTLDLGPQFTVAGTYIVNWVFTGGTNYTDQSGTATIVISDAAAVATTTTVSSSAATSTYGTAVTFTATVSAASGAVAPTGTMEFFDGLTSLGIDSVVDSTGVGTATYSLTLSNLTAGSHAIHAVFTATGSFAGSQSATLTQTVNKAVATVTVSGFTGTYNAAAHGATGTVVGVAGDLAAAGSSLNLGASFTNAPGGTANWSFTGGTNYTDQSGTVAIVINKAAATVTVSGFTGTYNAAAHGATGTVVGVAGDLAAAGSSLNLGASFTNAPGGTASWSFTGGTNYNDQNGTAAIVINKANAVVTVSGFTGTYNAAAHGATGTVVGVAGDLAAAGSSLNLGASFTNAPGGTASWSFTGGTNYNDQNGTAAIVINKANAVVTVTGFTGAFDNLPHGATGTVVGVAGDLAAAGSSLNLGATFTAVPGGIANWIFTGGTNYNDQSGTAAIVINNAAAVATTTTVSSSAATSTYGTAVTFTATVSVGSGTAAPTGTVSFFDGVTLLGTDSVADSTGVGIATWSFTTAGLTAGAHAIHAVYSAIGNFAGSQSADITQTVSQKSLTGNFTVANKTYDASTAAGVATQTLVGVLAGDVGSVSLSGGTATFDTANVGNNKTVTLTSAALSGAAAGNYSLTSVNTTTANITAKSLAGSFTVANKVYDGTTTATVQTRTLTGVLAGDAANVSLTGGTATFNTANAGLSKTVTLTGAALSGAGAGNYSLTAVNTTTADITALGLTGSFTVANRVYDSTTDAAVLTQALTGVIGADAVNLTGGIATFDTKDAGTGKVVRLVGATLTGTAAGNYSLTSVNTATATIAALGLTGNFAADNKVYDGTTDAVVLFTGLTGFYIGDDVFLDDLTGIATFADVNAGLSKAVTLVGATLGGVDAGNYSLLSVGTTTANIAKADATISVTGYNGVYSGGAEQASGTATGVGGLGDILGGLNLSGTIHTNAGTYIDTWVFADVTGNYNNANGTVSSIIEKAVATVTVTGFTGTIDGLAHGATGTVVGVDAGGAALGSSLNLGATFTTVPGGIATWVFTGGTNYTDQSNSVAIVISAVAAVGTTTTVSSSAATSTYGTAVTFTATVNAASGSAAPTGTVSFFDGATLLGTDSVANGTGVGTSTWSITISNLNAGAHAIHAVYNAAGSFTGSQSADISQTVSQRSLTGNFTVANKVYDTLTAATVQTRTLVGVLVGDVVNLIGGTATFANANVGTGKTVTLTGATLSGAASGNYSLTSVNTTTANITAKSLTGSFTVANKVYDATTVAAVQTRTLTGILAGDTVVLTGGTAAFANANVGINKTVTLTGAILTGAAQANYSLTSVNTTTANITAKSLTGSFTASNKTYDATAAATVQTRTLTGVIGAEAVSLSGGTATFSNANAGLNKTVTLAGATLIGAAAGNYSLTSVNTTTANIAKADATISVTGYNGVYSGGSEQASGTATGVGGLGDILGGLDLSGTVHTNAGTYTDSWTFTDVTGNYNNVLNGTVTSIIDQAVALVSVSGYTGAFDGLAHGATGTVVGVDAGGAALGSSLNLGVAFTNAPGGTANWVFTGGTNYTNQSGSVAIVINSVVIATTTTVTSSAATSTYGTAVTFTATVSAGSGSAAPTGTVSFFDGATLLGTDSVANSTGVGTSTWSITISNLNAGAHAIHAVYNATGNFTGSQSADISQTVNKATATITVAGYAVKYDGAAHTATGTATGVNGEDLSGGLNLSGTTHTNVGTGVYRDTVTYTDTTGNYNNATKFVANYISQATATITVTGYAVKYDGAVHQAAGAAVGVNGEDLSGGLNLSGTTHTNVGPGIYHDTVTYTDATGNYKNATRFVKDYISRATATITVTGYAVRFDGAAHTATGTATGVNGEDLSGGLNLSGTTHTNVGPGIYHDSVTFTDATGNYRNATRFVKDYISKATATITVTGYAVKYDGAAHTATGTATGVNGEDLSGGLNLSGTTHTNVGTGIYRDTVTYTDATGNYKNATRFVRDYISQATATIIVTGYAVRFDGAAHTATGTATGINGEDLSASLNLSGTTHTNGGTYIDTVTFTDATGNYKIVTKLLKDFIR